MGKNGVITFKSKGEFKKTFDFLNRVKNGDIYKVLDEYGERGVAALSKVTPIDSGKTSQAWHYRIEKERGGVSLVWYNDNMNEGVNIALMIQYGHGTPSGHYVRGKNYIKPAIKPIIDELEEAVWKEVTKA